MYKTLIVVDDEKIGDSLKSLYNPEKPYPEIISFDKYLTDFPKKNEPKTRLINLCDAQRYLSKGYYCSLLAEAREHKVLPSVRTINELRDSDVSQDINRVIQGELSKLAKSPEPQDFFIFFGQIKDPNLQTTAKTLFQYYPSPILKLRVKYVNDTYQIELRRFALSQIPQELESEFGEQLVAFTHNVWRMTPKKKRYRWDMAILIDPKEQVPPSNKEAIARFTKAAAKLGIQAEALSYEQITNISHFDALFIRETTAIDHHTYRLAAKAEKNGIITIDDTTSILRCCNKVYLQDAFSYRGVSAPLTRVISDYESDTLDALEAELPYPMVLKMPEGSFSRGVFKVKTRDELLEKLKILFADSALVLVQEYIYTEFDWRIGILNGRAIYASKYMMARNHWQIYNHGAKRFSSGGFETIPTFEVPKVVLDVALRAASIIGTGLYGVDVKHIDGKAYVLEVNDNPSIDHKVEDAYLGDELYMLIMSEFHRRLESRGR